MKYYVADFDDADFVHSEQRYVDYISTIWDSLPLGLRLLCDRRAPFSPEHIYLNDSNIQRIHTNFTKGSVELILLGECLAQDGTQIGSRLLTLKYGAVETLSCNGSYNYVFPFEELYSDHVWDEVEIIEQGLFEHRMLFVGHGSVELSIVFREFSISYVDTLHSGGM